MAAGSERLPRHPAGNEASKNVPRSPYPGLCGAGLLQLPAGRGAGKRRGAPQGGAAPVGKHHSGGGGRHQSGGRRSAGGGPPRVRGVCDPGPSGASQHYRGRGRGHGTPGGGSPGGHRAADQRWAGGPSGEAHRRRGGGSALLRRRRAPGEL